VFGNSLCSFREGIAASEEGQRSRSASSEDYYDPILDVKFRHRS
jgi:hypothetical protein